MEWAWPWHMPAQPLTALLLPAAPALPYRTSLMGEKLSDRYRLMSSYPTKRMPSALYTRQYTSNGYRNAFYYSFGPQPHIDTMLPK